MFYNTKNRKVPLKLMSGWHFVVKNNMFIADETKRNSIKIIKD